MAALRERLGIAWKAAVGIFDPSSLRAAHGMLVGIFPGAVGAPPVRGTRELLEAYSTMPWLRAAASKVASAVAACDWRLYAVRAPGERRARRVKALQRGSPPQRKLLMEQLRESGDLAEIRDHPLLDLLDSANAFQTGLAMRKVTQLHLDVVGEAFWLKERNGAGMPTAVWPVPPSWILSTPTPSRRSFRVSYRGWQGEIPDTEFTWFADPDPANPYGRGSGTGRALADELETDEYMAKTTKQWFFNNARPDFAVWPEEGDLTPAGLKDLRQRWLDDHQGFWRVARPFFASRKIGIHEFDQGDMRAMQFVQLRQHERDAIIQVLGGIPPEMFGILEQSNRATIEAADFLFSRWVVTPRLEFLRTTMQERLVPEFDERLVLDYVSPVEEDKEHRLKVMQAAPWAFEVDRWRAEAGDEALEGGRGEVFLLPFALTPIEDFEPGRAAIEVPAGPPPQALPPAGEEMEARSRTTRRSTSNGGGNGHGGGWRAALLGDARAFADAGDGEGERACLKLLAGDPDDLPPIVRLASRLEPRLRAAFLDAAARVRDGIDLERLASALLAGQAGGIEVEAGLGRLPAEFGALLPVLRQGFLAGAEFAHSGLQAAGLSMRFDLVNPHAVAWLERHGGELIRGISDEALQAVREAVASAFREGRGIPETAREIRQLVGLLPRQVGAVARFRQRLEEEGVAAERLEARVGRYAQAQLRHRANMVARTEVLRSSSEGQLSLWREARANGLLDPASTMRRWIVTRDDRLDVDICEPMDGDDRGLVGLEQPWTLPDGRKVMVPQEAHPQCRCAAALEFN